MCIIGEILQLLRPIVGREKMRKNISLDSNQLDKIGISIYIQSTKLGYVSIFMEEVKNK